MARAAFSQAVALRRSVWRSRSPTTAHQEQEQPNVRHASSYDAELDAVMLAAGYEAFARGDIPAVLEMFADDISWQVSGRSPLAGTHTGHDEVLDFFGLLGQLSNDTIHYAYTQGSCASHVGAGTVTVSIPTTGGVKHLTGALSVRRTALAIRAEASFPDGRFIGVGVVIPTRGTCFATPLTGATVVVTGVLSGT